MSYWSLYIPKEEEKVLKKKLEQVAAKRRWSFSQAVAEALKEHLIDEGKCLSDEEAWQKLSARAFFEGYSDKDSVYDRL